MHDEVSGIRKDFRSIAHPAINETLHLLGAKEAKDPDIYFIHLNHTNPVLTESLLKDKIHNLGWNISEQGMIWNL